MRYMGRGEEGEGDGRGGVEGEGEGGVRGLENGGGTGKEDDVRTCVSSTMECVVLVLNREVRGWSERNFRVIQKVVDEWSGLLGDAALQIIRNMKDAALYTEKRKGGAGGIGLQEQQRNAHSQP